MTVNSKKDISLNGSCLDATQSVGRRGDLPLTQRSETLPSPGDLPVSQRSKRLPPPLPPARKTVGERGARENHVVTSTLADVLDEKHNLVLDLPSVKKEEGERYMCAPKLGTVPQIKPKVVDLAAMRSAGLGTMPQKKHNVLLPLLSVRTNEDAGRQSESITSSKKVLGKRPGVLDVVEGWSSGAVTLYSEELSGKRHAVVDVNTFGYTYPDRFTKRAVGIKSKQKLRIHGVSHGTGSKTVPLNVDMEATMNGHVEKPLPEIEDMKSKKKATAAVCSDTVVEGSVSNHYTVNRNISSKLPLKISPVSLIPIQSVEMYPQNQKHPI